MSKHTPGEWKVSSSTMVFVDDGKLKMICNTLPLLYSDVAEEDLPLVQCAANARLIAAAPELLEALRGELSAGRSDCNDRKCGACSRCRSYAAIAKAEGA